MTDKELARAIRQVLLNLIDVLERWMNTRWAGVVKARTAELRKAYKEGKLII